MATKESLVKAKVKAALDAMGAYHFSPVTAGFGKSGVCDIVACYYGHFFGIECKAGKGKTTALQEREMSRMSAAGGHTTVVYEDDVDDLVMWMNTVLARHD